MYFTEYKTCTFLYFIKYILYLCKRFQRYEGFFSAFYRKLEETDMHFERYLKSQMDWNNRLTAITDARGTGKTTLLLQYIKRFFLKK